MRAFVIKEFGQPGEVVEVPEPQVGPGEVLVRVRAASVNPMDAFVASGGTKDYAETRLPLIPGIDAVGTIEAVGPGGNGFKPGDEVVVTAATKSYWGGGTFAELVAVPRDALARKPAWLDDTIAASLPQAGLTALAAIDELDPQAGQVIAVVGATGGVGSWFTQLAALRGARVIALVSSEKAEYARSLGAAGITEYADGGVVEHIRALAPEGVDAIADFSGNAELIEKLSALLHGGGRLTSSAATLDAQAYAERGLKASQANRAHPGRMTELLDLLASGQLKPPVARLVPLREAAQALAEVGQRHNTGKVVLSIAD